MDVVPLPLWPSSFSLPPPPRTCVAALHVGAQVPLPLAAGALLKEREERKEGVNEKEKKRRREAS